jgi:hypothetical protein
MADVQLTPSQAAELAAVEQAVLVARQNLLRAERAGLDVREVQEALEKANNKRQGMLREFSPGAISRRQR